MNHETILMRDLCDTLMQNHAPAVNAKIEDGIVQFRASLRPEQRKKFNDILDLVNSSDSEYAYEAFKCGMKYYSEFFDGEKIAIDAEVKVLYQEDEQNNVGQYIIFSKVYNEQRKLHGATKKTITETIRICKDRNVLKEYLENREQEVVDMMMTLFDDEQILKAYTKDIVKEKAMKMIKNGKMSMDEISEYFPELLESDIKEIEAEVMQLV